MHDVFDVTAPVELKPFPIPDQELLKRYEVLQTACVNDMLDKYYQLYHQVIPEDIKPTVDGQKLVGFAYTLKSVRTPIVEGETTFRDRAARFLSAFFPNSVAVIDSSGDYGVSHFGEMMATGAKTQGCIGAVIDGGIRDLDGINKLGLKTWCRYRTPRDTTNRARNIAWMIPINIRDVVVNPGDVVFGDIDGVVIIPRDIAYDVLLKTEAIMGEEDTWRKMLATGISPTEAVERGVRW